MTSPAHDRRYLTDEPWKKPGQDETQQPNPNVFEKPKGKKRRGSVKDERGRDQPACAVRFALSAGVIRPSRQSGGSKAPSLFRSSVQGTSTLGPALSDKFFCGSAFTMAPRAYWKGFLRLSLVSCPIALFPPSSEREKIRFHQINRKTDHRIRYVKVDADTGEEVDKGRHHQSVQKKKGEYIPIEPEELEAVAIESKHTIEIDEFVPHKEIDELMY
jgi:hypothetical protein